MTIKKIGLIVFLMVFLPLVVNVQELLADDAIKLQVQEKARKILEDIKSKTYNFVIKINIHDANDKLVKQREVIAENNVGLRVNDFDWGTKLEQVFIVQNIGDNYKTYATPDFLPIEPFFLKLNSMLAGNLEMSESFGEDSFIKKSFKGTEYVLIEFLFDDFIKIKGQLNYDSFSWARLDLLVRDNKVNDWVLVNRLDNIVTSFKEGINLVSTADSYSTSPDGNQIKSVYKVYSFETNVKLDENIFNIDNK